jgi:hypothetical protein
LADDDGWSRTDQQLAYNAGASFLAYVLDLYGAQRLRGIYPAPSGELPDRIRSVYGKSLDELEAEWQRYYTTFVSPS